MNLEYQPLLGIINFNYLVDHILYQIFKNILKKHDGKIDNPSIRIYI